MKLASGSLMEITAGCSTGKCPLRDTNGNIVKWYGSSLDIEERKTAEVALRNSEAHLAEAQRLSRTGSFGWKVSSGEIFWSDETFRRDG
jgi:PAS domain-containing protein